MRGRTSTAQSRLRSGGYKCNLCGRRVIDAATLERHQSTIHNLPSKAKKVSFKVKPSILRTKLTKADKEKAFDDLLKDEILAEAKPKIKIKNEIRVIKQEQILAASSTEKKYDAAKNGDQSKIEVVDDDEKTKNSAKAKNRKRKVQFECPVCDKSFSIYFTAHKHIQKFHPINAAGKRVAPNSLDLVQPIRVEQCVKCNHRICSTEIHVCNHGAEYIADVALQYVCTACHQSFISLKTFDMHVAGLHSDGVDSMFFPTVEEFNNWRLDMEKQTNIEYSILGEYDSKKIYRCNYAHDNDLNDKTTSHFCPSTMVVQDFSKGTQVHFYKRHYGHHAQAYLLATKYNKYSITSFLKNPDVVPTPLTKAKDAKDVTTYAQFKKLMESIIVDAKHVDNARLKSLTEKALQMTALLSINDCITVLPTNKTMSDKEITDVLESNHPMRRRSADTVSNPPAAKRSRNKSLFVQTSESPKIVNSFSLAKDDQTDPLQIKEDTNVTSAIESPEANTTKTFGRVTRFSQSPSFNDTYKDFIDQTIKATIAADRTKPKDRTRYGARKARDPLRTDPDETKDTQLDIIGTKILTPAIDDSNSVGNTSTPKPKNNKFKTPKVELKESPKIEITVENITPRTATPPSVKKIKADFEYEVREQENDCNILILKI